jgi:hypothetical protein
MTSRLDRLSAGEPLAHAEEVVVRQTGSRIDAVQ